MQRSESCGCHEGGNPRLRRPFSIFEKRENLLVELFVGAARGLHLSTEETYAKDEASGSKIFVEESRVQRGGCEVHQRESKPHVRQLFTEANHSFIALFAVSGPDEDGGRRGFFTILHGSEQGMLLEGLDELGDEEFAGVWQSTVLDKKAA